MWFFLAAGSLVLTSIAGDNVALVPFLTAKLEREIYGTIFLAYCVLGAVTAAISAWIGVKTGRELPFVAYKLFGCRGKRFLAVLILVVSLPASSLTGGLFAGLALQSITGLPFSIAAAVCLVVATLLACGWVPEVLKISNSVTMLLVPVMGALLFLASVEPVQPLSAAMGLDRPGINLPVMLALWGYNAGGMRPALMVEAAAYMRKKGERAVWLAVAAKIMEGLVTMGIAFVALRYAAGAPLALADVAGLWWGDVGRKVMTVMLLCLFLNTMAPAMMVNARQIMTLTAMSYTAAMVAAVFLVMAGTFLGVERLLYLLSWTGMGIALYTVAAPWLLHKCRQQHR